MLECHGESIAYRAAGLAMTLRALIGTDGASSSTSAIRAAYLDDFWRPGSLGEWCDIAAAALLWPFGMVAAASWLTWRNGRILASGGGPARWRQFLGQLRLAMRGVLPPCYYMFELHRPERTRALPDYLSRAETKEGVYRILARRRGAQSPLSDKVGFAAHCADHGLPTPQPIAIARNGALDGPITALPSADLFLKPVRASGGKGAERWDYRDGRYHGPDGAVYDQAALLEHLVRRSGRKPAMLQPRLANHPALDDLNNGALATVRVLTCLDEAEQPEIMAAVLRMAIGANRTVDNLHAGGIAAGVALATGRVGRATNLGTDVRLGWLDRHPGSDAPISGRILPRWDEVRTLAIRAHRAFADHLLIGWDIAILADGVCLVEGNSGPDLDIIQRVTLEPIGCARFGALVAHHLGVGAT